MQKGLRDFGWLIVCAGCFAGLTAAGVVWVRSMVPINPPQVPPPTERETALLKPADLFPHEATLPWKRDTSTTRPVMLRPALAAWAPLPAKDAPPEPRLRRLGEMQIPWTRDLAHIDLPPGKLPQFVPADVAWMRDAKAPAPVTLLTATLPWARDLADPVGTPTAATVPWRAIDRERRITLPIAEVPFEDSKD